MPIKNQLQVDQSIHMNICILNLYCEQKWMVVQSFHNINPGAAHRSTRVQATDGSAAHRLSYKRPKIPSKFVQCYKKSHTQPKEQAHQRSQFQELHREDVTIQMLACRKPVLLLPGSLLWITVASLTLWELSYLWAAEQARWKSCRRSTYGTTGKIW